VVQAGLSHLSWNGKRESIPDILKLLDRKDPFAAMIIQSAIGALRKLGARDAAPRLIRFLREEQEHHLATVAAECLADMNYREALPDLRKLLGRDDARRAVSVLPALVEFGDRESLPRIRHLVQSRVYGVNGPAAAALAALEGRDALPTIREAMKNAGEDERPGLLDALVRLAPDEAIPLLRETMKDRLSSGFRGLLALGQPEARPIVDRWLDDPSGPTRKLGLESLFQLEGRRLILRLRSTLSDPDDFMRETAAKLLVQAGERDGVPVLLESKKNLIVLNAVRAPALWERFATTRLDEPFYGSAKEVLEHVARKLGLAFEAPKTDAANVGRWTNVYHRVGSRFKPRPMAEELEYFPWFVVLEPDRLRAIPPDQAPAFWSAWWETEKSKR
jgi:HEAT repeat protein